ncbi:MAG: hypothetical protein LBE67_06350 [Kocuria palustris]|nr:hypothetical protein [Kocuria palustris]
MSWGAAAAQDPGRRLRLSQTCCVWRIPHPMASVASLISLPGGRHVEAPSWVVAREHARSS